MNKTRLFMLLVVVALSLGIVGVSMAADYANPTLPLNDDTSATKAGKVTDPEGGVNSSVAHMSPLIQPWVGIHVMCLVHPKPFASGRNRLPMIMNMSIIFGRNFRAPGR